MSKMNQSNCLFIDIYKMSSIEEATTLILVSILDFAK